MKSRVLRDYCYSSKALTEISGVVVHYFSAINVDPENKFDMRACWDLFHDLNRPRERRERYMLDDAWPAQRMYASAHLLIGRDGETWRLVEFDRVAWHAGASMMAGRRGCNDFTLGIELVGTRDSGFSRAQYLRLAELLAEYEAKYQFPRENVLGHDTVRHAAREAGSTKPPKYDPSGQADGQGTNFDWWYLGKLWNDIRLNPAGTTSIDDLDAVLEADPNSG